MPAGIYYFSITDFAASLEVMAIALMYMTVNQIFGMILFYQ